MRGLVEPERGLWKSYSRGDASTERNTTAYSTDRTIDPTNRNGPANRYAQSYTYAYAFTLRHAYP